MTWLFSKALMDSVNLHSSPEPVEAFSEATYSDGEPSAQWSVMPTPQGFWRNDKMMDASRLSQFGPTLRLLTEQHGEAVLTLFLEGFPVRTYPNADQVPVLAEQDPAFGLSSLESLAKFDPETSTWRTPQFSLLGDWELYSETWPRWGLMRNGECWARETSAVITKDSGYGSVPTPTASMGSHGVAWARARTGEHRSNLADYLAWRHLQEGGEETPGLAVNPSYAEFLMNRPLGWTDLEPLETDKMRLWLQQHSPNFREGSNAA